jgi:hypothetical protein
MSSSATPARLVRAPSTMPKRAQTWASRPWSMPGLGQGFRSSFPLPRGPTERWPRAMPPVFRPEGSPPSFMRPWRNRRCSSRALPPGNSKAISAASQQDTQTISGATGLAGRYAETRFALGTQMHPVLRITRFSRLPGQILEMGLNAQPNEVVTVQSSPDLKQWQTVLSTNLPPTGSSPGPIARIAPPRFIGSASEPRSPGRTLSPPLSGSFVGRLCRPMANSTKVPTKAPTKVRDQPARDGWCPCSFRLFDAGTKKRAQICCYIAPVFLFTYMRVRVRAWERAHASSASSYERLMARPHQCASAHPHRRG